MSGLLRGTLACLSIACVCVACGSPQGDAPLPAAYTPPAAPPTHVPHDYRGALTSDPAVLQACDTYASAELAYESRCTIAIHPNKDAFYMDRYRLACREAASEPGAGFDVAAIARCATALGEWKDARCQNRPTAGSIRHPLEVCKSLLPAGTAREGAACTDDAQCASGTCARNQRLSVATDGTVATFESCGLCARVVELGAACDPGLPGDGRVPAVCGSDASCKLDESALGQLVGACVPLVAEGVDCGAVLATTRTSACAAGLRCSYLSIPGKALCIAPKAEGSACDEQNECAADLVCHELKCSRYAVEGEGCRVAGATIPLDTGCVGALACDPSSRTCVAPAFGSLKSPNQSCGRDLVQVDDCQFGSYLCADSKDLLCPTARGAEGASCSTVADCDLPSLCVDGMCQPLTTAACADGAIVD